MMTRLCHKRGSYGYQMGIPWNLKTTLIDALAIISKNSKTNEVVAIVNLHW